MNKAPRGRRGRAAPEPKAKSQGDSDGLLVILLVLWLFGFVSFNWPGREEGGDKAAAVEQDLARAEAQLTQITAAIEEMEADSTDLVEQRALLTRQVAELRSARDSIALSLQAASSIVVPSATSKWYRWLESLFTGVLGNLISVAVVGAVSWLHGRRVGRADSQVERVGRTE